MKSTRANTAMSTAALTPTPTPALAPVDSPEDGLELGDAGTDEDDVAASVCELEAELPLLLVLELELELVLELAVDVDVLDTKSFALYRIETPYPFTASVTECRVATMVVNAAPSVTVVVASLANPDTQAWPGKLSAASV